MYTETIFFQETQNKSATLTIRLTPKQKQCISDLAEQRGMTVSRFLLSLVGNEYNSLYNTHDTATAKDPIDIHMSVSNNNTPPNNSSIINKLKTAQYDPDLDLDL